MKLDISSKLWITIISIIFVIAIFNYWTTAFLYEHLYVEQSKKQLSEKGARIAQQYNGGFITPELRERVKLSNSLTSEEIVLNDNPSDFGACLPVHDKAIENLLSVEQKERLNKGETITVVGEHARFKRDVIAVAVPLINKSNQLVGAIFVYKPLATITEAVSELRFILVVYMIAFLIFGVIVGKIITNRMTKPLREMEAIAKKMMNRDFDAKVSVLTEDEIGRLGQTLNHLSDSLKTTINLLSKEKKQLSQILDGIRDSVLTIDKDQKFILCNNPARKLMRKLGLTQETFFKIPEIETYIQEVTRGKEVLVTEIEVKGRRFTLYFGPLIEEDSFWGIVLVIHDVTDERIRESEAREFLAVVSHELRTPLSYVRGYTEALMDGLAESKQTQDHYLSTIHNETERMERLVNDLLDLAQLERSTYPMNIEEVRLDTIVDQVIERYRNLYEKKGVDLQFRKKQSLWIIGDNDRIIQILVNLLDNALRHTEKEGKVIVEIYPVKEDVVLQISDTGEGMEKEHLDRIGEKFFRANKARSRKNGGTGLGLAIVKQIVERLDGKMEVESDVGIGTTFRIYFPSL